VPVKELRHVFLVLVADGIDSLPEFVGLKLHFIVAIHTAKLLDTGMETFLTTPEYSPIFFT
jgi:hypothetical protein